MKLIILSLALLFLANFSFGQNLPDKLNETDFSIGKTVTLASSVLGENREINIYLPLNYSADSAKTYPVIYLLDGSKDEDFIHIAGIVQFGSFSWINMVPESIVVGIANVDRQRDFTSPSQNKKDNKGLPTSGKSAKFIQFIEKELQPFIDSNYKTQKKKTLVGQSLGGLLATEILFTHPDLFDNYVIVSPSLWWNDEKLLESTPKWYTSNKSIYIAVGKEGKIMERLANELNEKLAKDKGDQTKLNFLFLPSKTHGDVLHQAAYHAFETIFKPEEKKKKK